jgi:hypothetical protein
MPLRPMDLQVILQVSRNVEKMQLLQQQYSQRQQEQLALYMQRNFRARQHQTEATEQSTEGWMDQVSEDGKRKEQQKRKKKDKEKKKIGGNVDFFA